MTTRRRSEQSEHPAQALGVVVVELLSGEEGESERTHDPAFSRLLVVLNARPDAQSLPWPPGQPPCLYHGWFVSNVLLRGSTAS